MNDDTALLPANVNNELLVNEKKFLSSIDGQISTQEQVILDMVREPMRKLFALKKYRGRAEKFFSSQKAVGADATDPIDFSDVLRTITNQQNLDADAESISETNHSHDIVDVAASIPPVKNANSLGHRTNGKFAAASGSTGVIEYCLEALKSCAGETLHVDKIVAIHNVQYPEMPIAKRQAANSLRKRSKRDETLIAHTGNKFQLIKGGDE